jgi:hypothetical protein
MPFRERWPEQALQVMKEEMLAEVASPAIPPGLRLKRSNSGEYRQEYRAESGRVLTLENDTSFRCLVLFAFYHPLPFLPLILACSSGLCPPNGQCSR